MVKTFRYWQIYRVLNDNYNLLNCHFEIIEPYQPVLTSFPFLSFLSRSSDKVPFCMTGHNFHHTILIFNNPIKALKTLWEKEKMLVTSIFSFTHNVSTYLRTIFNF